MINSCGWVTRDKAKRYRSGLSMGPLNFTKDIAALCAGLVCAAAAMSNSCGLLLNEIRFQIKAIYKKEVDINNN